MKCMSHAHQSSVLNAAFGKCRFRGRQRADRSGEHDLRGPVFGRQFDIPDTESADDLFNGAT